MHFGFLQIHFLLNKIQLPFSVIFLHVRYPCCSFLLLSTCTKRLSITKCKKTYLTLSHQQHGHFQLFWQSVALGPHLHQQAIEPIICDTNLTPHAITSNVIVAGFQIQDAQFKVTCKTLENVLGFFCNVKINLCGQMTLSQAKWFPVSEQMANLSRGILLHPQETQTGWQEFEAGPIHSDFVGTNLAFFFVMSCQAKHKHLVQCIWTIPKSNPILWGWLVLSSECNKSKGTDLGHISLQFLTEDVQDTQLPPKTQVFDFMVSLCSLSAWKVCTSVVQPRVTQWRDLTTTTSELWLIKFKCQQQWVLNKWHN